MPDIPTSWLFERDPNLANVRSYPAFTTLMTTLQKRYAQFKHFDQ